MSKKVMSLNKKYVWMLFVNTALLLVLYLVCVRFFPIVTLWVYTLVSMIYDVAAEIKNIDILNQSGDFAIAPLYV